MLFRIRKSLLFYVVGVLIASICSFTSVRAEDADDKQIPLNQYGVRSLNPYVVERLNVDENRLTWLLSPSAYTAIGISRQVAAVPKPDIARGTNSIANVPAMTWVFGCSATSAAMMFGHYDNTVTQTCIPPHERRVFPMTNATWGTAYINGETRALCH